MSPFRKTVFAAIFIALYFGLPGLHSLPTCKAEELTDAKEIVRRDEKRYDGEDLCTGMHMTLTDAGGGVRQRYFVRYYKYINGLKVDLIKFFYPEDIRDTGTSTQQQKTEDDIQYLYLPAAKKLRRITAKDQSWMGSDMTYEDLRKLKIDNFNYKLLGSDKIDGNDTYVIELTPITPDKSSYGKIVRWFRKDILFLVKGEYYDKNGKLLKVGYLQDIREDRGAYIAWHTWMDNVQDHHHTETYRLWADLNTGIPDEMLSTRQLEKSIETYNRPANLKESIDKAVNKIG